MTAFFSLVPFAIALILSAKIARLIALSRRLSESAKKTAAFLVLIWGLFGIMWIIVGIWIVLDAGGVPFSTTKWLFVSALVPLLVAFVLVFVARLQRIPLRPIPRLD
jgi:hypothetical protein